MSTSTSVADPAAGRAACEPRTAFVLAGGAALGAMQAGMVRAAHPEPRRLPPAAPALAAAVHAITVLTNARLHGDLARYAPSAELIVLPAANPGHIPPTDFGHADQLITRALAATRTALATGTPHPPRPRVGGGHVQHGQQHGARPEGKLAHAVSEQPGKTRTS
jgi:hypothetical protein